MATVRPATTATRETFDDTFCELLPRLYRRALALTGCRHTAQDALQDTYLKLVTHPERLTDHPMPYAYAFTTVVSVLRDGWRRHHRETPHADLTDLTAGGCDSGGIGDWEAHRETVRLLTHLTTKQAAIVLLVDVEGHTIDQTAALLSLHRGTVARARGRALDKLHALLIYGSPDPFHKGRADSDRQEGPSDERA